MVLHDFKLLRSTIPKLITLPHNQGRPQNKSTNNCSITLHVNEILNKLSQKHNGPSLICQTNLFSLSRSLGLSLAKENPVALYINLTKQSRPGLFNLFLPGAPLEDMLSILCTLVIKLNYLDTHIKFYVFFSVIKVEEQILSVTNDNQLFATSTQVSIN